MHSTTIKLSDFAWSVLSEEADRQGVPLEELLAHAAMYYLADLDSGRIAAKVVSAKDDEDPPPPGRFGRSKPE